MHYRHIVGSAFQSEKARVIPPPAADQAASQVASETAVFAGGCFWGVQGVFQHVKASPGRLRIRRRRHSDGRVRDGEHRPTGHAESVQITFDPQQISYGRCCRSSSPSRTIRRSSIGRGRTVGTQYRSAIFPANAEQARVAKAYIDQLNAGRAFDEQIVTKIEPDRPFYPAEDVPPGLPDPEPALPVHRHQRSAEDQRAEARVPGGLSRGARAGRRLAVRLAGVRP